MTEERFTLRLTKVIKQPLDHHAKEIGVSLNALIRQILWDWAKHNPSTNRTDES